MTEGKEKFSIEPEEKKPIEPKYTPEDYEAVGKQFAQIDSFIARSYLRAANLSNEKIEKILTETPKKQKTEKKQMDPEEKKKMFEKMTEDFEKKAEEAEKEAEKTEEKTKKAKKNEEKDLYKSLAKAYRRELKEMSQEIKNP